MDGFLDIFNQYARSELFILVPVLYIIGKLLVTSKVKNERIPLLITGLSVILCLIYTFATVPIISVGTVFLALFTSVTQGILFAGASILSSLLFCSKAISPNKTNDDQGQQ